MRRYQKWLSVGLLALTPGITLAGPFSGFSKQSPASQAAKAPGADQNQEIANRVKQALVKARLDGQEIEIYVDKGVTTLKGVVTNPDLKKAAATAAKSVKGVTKVDNKLAVAEPKGRPVQQAAASQPKGARPPRARQVNYQAAYEGQEPVQIPQGAVPQGIQPIPANPASYGPPPAAMQGPPGAGGGNMLYNQPNHPDYAWPAYAQYPNYAAVTYPTQYSASAWPYIGPFYPYPQVPLGWRKATLEWDDGYWNLSFSPRTDRWWWFLNPANW
ncbi:MAG: BON domain-containing protein [Planctomycetales bacterium]